MAEVYPGLGDYLATSEDIDLGPALDETAEKVRTLAVSEASQHVRTGAYLDSIQVEVDRSSPSGRDRIVFSDDPAAAAIEWGHVSQGSDGAARRVEGQHIFGKAADAAVNR